MSSIEDLVEKFLEDKPYMKFSFKFDPDNRVELRFKDTRVGDTLHFYYYDETPGADHQLDYELRKFKASMNDRYSQRQREEAYSKPKENNKEKLLKQRKYRQLKLYGIF